MPDGSYLSTIYRSDKDRRQGRNGIAVRVIEYRLEGVAGAEPLYRLLTTIPDPEQAPAQELAALKADEDPDRLSFLHAVRVVRHKLPQFVAIPPSAEGSLSSGRAR